MLVRLIMFMSMKQQRQMKMSLSNRELTLPKDVSADFLPVFLFLFLSFYRSSDFSLLSRFPFFFFFSVPCWLLIRERIQRTSYLEQSFEQNGIFTKSTGISLSLLDRCFWKTPFPRGNWQIGKASVDLRGGSKINFLITHLGRVFFRLQTWRLSLALLYLQTGTIAFRRRFRVNLSSCKSRETTNRINRSDWRSGDV